MFHQLCRSVSGRNCPRRTDSVANTDSPFRAFGIANAERHAAVLPDPDADASFGADAHPYARRSWRD